MLEKNKIKHLKNYTPPEFKISKTELEIFLDKSKTIVQSRLYFTQEHVKNKDLILDGNKLRLKEIKINQKKISLNDVIISEYYLRIPFSLLKTKNFLLEIKVEINPSSNTELEGLYLSENIFCTQCEAEGFRRITYFLDRPDILSIYKVKIIGNYNVMLSNGNVIKKDKNYIEWYDPYPKPSYLFALVAGELESFEDKFITKSKRKVELKIYVQKENLNFCFFAMKALKKSMRWEEKIYGLEYDLDNFMIVAINDFNMGAMENKGLNIFNSKYILADEKVSTDQDFESIERIIAHEYFHNWTGNRVTCRDWFQLSLKEGLTVFRDQQYSSHQKDPVVQRINDVKFLRSKQFREDSGPLSHPVRPSQYVEINNFYTTTVYEKGAEIIRMLETIYGKKKFLKKIKLFLKEFDGQACTVEDLLSFFEKNISQFILWYDQPGTPELRIYEKFINNEYEIKFKQLRPKNFPKKTFKPMLIPIKFELLNDEGEILKKEKVFVLNEKEKSVKYKNITKKPILSILRDFSAPVKMKTKLSSFEKKILVRKDTDLFNRWEQMQILMLQSLEKTILKKNNDYEIFHIIEELLFEKNLSDEFKTIMTYLPGNDELITHLSEKKILIDPDSIIHSKKEFNKLLSKFLGNKVEELICKKLKSYKNSFSREDIGNRKLRIRLNQLLMYQNPKNQYLKKMLKVTSNMTEQISALSMIVEHDVLINEFQNFKEYWKEYNNLIDKWHSILATNLSPKNAANVVNNISQDKNFKWKNPNRFRSLIGSFANNNLAGFHKNDGSGYDLIFYWIIKMDKINPQSAASLCTCFDNWKNFDKVRQNKILSGCLDLIEKNNLSKNSREIIQKILKNKLPIKEFANE